MSIKYLEILAQTAIANHFPGNTWPHYKKAYTFTQDWFTPRICHWRTQLFSLRAKPKINALEIGTFEGRSAFWLLENILTHQSSRLVCIDPFYSKSCEEIFRNNLQISNCSEKVEVFAGTSKTVFPKLSGSKFDLIYIDGSHDAADVEVDAELSWPLLKSGAILIFDDYLWCEEGSENCPKIAIDRFIQERAEQIKIIHSGYQMVIQKF